MSTQTTKIIVGAVLLLHGLGHGGAFGALLWIRRFPGTDTGAWQPARSWLVPSLSASAAATVAGIFWVLSAIGFVAASLSFWDVLVPGDIWRQLALGSSIISILGIVFFFGTWPIFNMLAALAVNMAVFVTQLWMNWPPQAMFGK